MKPILVAYCTNAGSTTDVAAVIGEELGRGGAQVDVRSIHACQGLCRTGFIAAMTAERIADAEVAQDWRCIRYVRR